MPMIESAEQFVRLRTSDDAADQRRATHDEAAITVWTDVIRRFPAMRSWVAHNKTVPSEILETLASDDDARVRGAVAMRRATPALVLEALAQDPDEGVRLRVARNSRAPRAALLRLADDPWNEARRVATERLGADGDAGSQGSEGEVRPERAQSFE
ncbi:hypothetical protein [Patulibacter defluvii]|uniref:hypothetical protein n=1 Tax=Patulibacter defluvii TaxID=3095358 RepID=UPI002A765C9D|nr:hypothetical protein [Patulibacter sp. DM4]